MVQSSPSASEIKEMAEKNAKEVIAVKDGGGDGLARRAEQLTEFQRTWQPYMSDKEYTALFRTYNDWFMAVMADKYAPGTSLPVAPTTAASIKDGDEIYRPNAEPMNPVQWKTYLLEIEKMAQKFAHEIAILTANGGETVERTNEHYGAIVEFSIEHGLSHAEMDEQTSFYLEKYNEALKLETDAHSTFISQNVRQCRELVEDNWKSFLTFAAAGSAELGKECLIRFDEKINDIARGIKDQEGRVRYLATIENERAIIFDEYTKNPKALKRRLGVLASGKGEYSVGVTSASAISQSVGHSSKKNLGNLAVNTAVRATVWEVIISIFRFLR